MWKVFSASVLGIAFVFASVILGLITWGIRYAPDDRTFFNLLFVTIFAATPVLTLALLIGRSTWVWQTTCTLFPGFAKRYDVSGTWVGKTRSTFPVGTKVVGAELYEGEMQMKVTQSWLTIRVKTTRPEGTTIGRSIVAEISLADADPVYRTVFTSRNFEPVEGDSADWFGTSRFELVPDKDMVVGNYCSNRGYVSGSATAGDFSLHRIAGGEP